MSSIDNAKRGMGWNDPKQRAGCHNCKHVQQDASNINCMPQVRCLKGGFYTKRFAICNHWKDVVGVRG